MGSRYTGERARWGMSAGSTVVGRPPRDAEGNERGKLWWQPLCTSSVSVGVRQLLSSPWDKKSDVAVSTELRGG